MAALVAKDYGERVNNWPVMLLVFAAALMFRWQGDSWPVIVAKLVGLVVLFLIVVVILSLVMAQMV